MGEPTNQQIDELITGLFDELGQKLEEKSGEPGRHPYPVGSPVFIRSVTMYYTGVLVEVYPQELVLEEAAWIPETGRFADALKKATFGEVEPFPVGRVVIGRGAIVDCCQLAGSPPREQK